MSLRRTALSITLLLTAGLGIGFSAADELKVLVFSKTKGFRHDSIETGIAAVKKLGEENSFGVDATEDSAKEDSAKMDIQFGVQCESCHGPSAAHVAAAGKIPLIPASLATCVSYHDSENSPHFIYETYWNKIRH